jgi:hypothetical protein
VTAHAVRRRAGERAVLVAALAGRSRVRAAQLKVGRLVIERYVAPRTLRVTSRALGSKRPGVPVVFCVAARALCRRLAKSFPR